VVEIKLIYSPITAGAFSTQRYADLYIYTTMIIGCNRGPPNFFFRGKDLLKMLKRRPASARGRGQSRAVAGVRLEPVH
jgi:hypothetical protein